MTAVISMWSGPRNISTTMMRAFGNRADTRALDEPFYAAYLARTGAAHPYREETLSVYPTQFSGVIDWISGATEKPLLFLKHIAYHLPDDTDFTFLKAWRNFLLIRDPRAMIASFADKYGDVAPIIRSYEMALGVFDHLTAQGLACPIIDAGDIQRAPEGHLRALCSSLQIDFDPAMLAWPCGARPEDGPWAPHWYDAVRRSTGFNPLGEKKHRLSNELEKVAALALPAYRTLYARRLTA
ncbi:MAG: hypothetical protein U5J99_04110 [Parvularculaceae bacterium]|nr:hypothetical protein [Parvularculaceae bacterium]